MYRLGKTFAAIVSNGFTANSLLYPCNTKMVIVNFLFSGGGGGGGEVGVENKDFCWNCMYRLGKTFAAIVSNGFTANTFAGIPVCTKTVISQFPFFLAAGKGG